MTAERLMGVQAVTFPAEAMTVEGEAGDKLVGLLTTARAARDLGAKEAVTPGTAGRRT